MTASPSPPATDRRPDRVAASPASGWALVALVGLAGLLVAHHPVLLSGFRLMHGELGDTRFVNYLLEHSWLWLGSSPLHASYWDPPFFHPATNTLAYSELLLGAAPLYWPWRLAGLAPDTAFQCWLLSVSATNFGLMAVLLRRGFGFTAWPAAVGAFLFAFGSPRLAQAGHFQLLPQAPTLLCVWALIEFFRSAQPRAARRWLALACAAAVLQLYAGFYLGWFLVLGTFLVAGAALVLREPRRLLLDRVRPHRGALLVAGVAGALALLPMVVHYAAAVRELGPRTFRDVLPMLPRPASWLYMGAESWLYGWTASGSMFRGLPYPWEHLLGVGLATMALAATGLWRARGDRRILLLSIALVTLMVVSLRLPREITLWGAFHAVFPGAQGIRAMTRIVMLALIPLAIGVAAALARLVQARRFGAAAALGLLSMAEQGRTTMHYDKQAARDEIAWLAGQVPPGCTSFLFTPVLGARPFYKYELDAMWAADLAGVPTVNGYSGNVPPGHLRIGDNFIRDASDRSRVEDFLRRWGQGHRLAVDRGCWLRLVPSDTPETPAALDLELPAGAVGP